jgi:hypothetical protein
MRHTKKSSNPRMTFQNLIANSIAPYEPHSKHYQVKTFEHNIGSNMYDRMLKSVLCLNAFYLSSSSAAACFLEFCTLSDELGPFSRSASDRPLPEPLPMVA